MFKIFVRHTLEDYAVWKELFDGHDEVRKSHGCTGVSVFRNAENSNEVLVETVWENKEGAMEFMHDPSLKETMEKARVIGAPEFSFVG